MKWSFHYEKLMSCKGVWILSYYRKTMGNQQRIFKQEGAMTSLLPDSSSPKSSV